MYTLFECFLIFIFQPACFNELKTEPADMFLSAAVANFGQCAIVEQSSLFSFFVTTELCKI